MSAHLYASLAASGLPVLDLASPGVALLTALAVGFLLGFLPLGAAEAAALAAGAATPPALVVALVVSLTVGHMTGKVIWYWFGTLGDRARGARARRWVSEGRGFLARHPSFGAGMMSVSALVSLPPFHLVAIAAGLVRMPVAAFVAIGFTGRLLRFGGIAAFPAALGSLLA